MDGVKVDFYDQPRVWVEEDQEWDGTNSPQPGGYVYNPGTPEILADTFFADEEIDPSTVTAVDAGQYYGIAHAEALGWPANCPDYGVGGAGEYYMIFDTETSGSVINIRPGILGDANLDGTVDEKDASVVGANWLGTGKAFTDGDFNLDGTVDDADAAILAANWGQTATLEPTPSEGSAVPEPTTWCLLAGALAMLAVWRRKSR